MNSTPFRTLASALFLPPLALMTCLRSLVIALVALGLSPLAHSNITIQSYWQLGEGAAIGTDSSSVNDGTSNPFNNTTGSTILTDSPSGAAGSPAYAHTSGLAYQGLWMYGAGSTAQTVPADNWGVQFMVRSTATESIAPADAFRAVFGMLDAPSGGLVIEARRHYDGNVYWDVNRSGQANLITPRNATTTVALDTWTDLALVRSDGVLTFYVNGVSVGTSTASIGTTDGLFALGFQQGVGTNNFIGDFDEARLFTFNPGEFMTADLSMTKLMVAYDGNGHTGGSVPVDSSSYFPGTSVTVLGAGTLTRAGFIFTGWDTLAGGGGTSYSPAATFNIGDADTTLYAQWAVATATITAPATFPGAISTTYGTESSSTSVAVSGNNLVEDITATAPGNLEVSSDDANFGATVTFTQSGGSASGTLYARLKNNTPVFGSPYDSQSITLTSTGATPVTVATTASGNTVTSKALTVASTTAQDKMYDATTTGTVIGTLQTAEEFGSGNSSDGAPYLGDTLTVSAPGTFSSSAVGGPYTLTVGTFTLDGSSAGNYALTQPTGLTLSASILDTATWTQLAGGSWNSDANWLDGVIGTGAGNTADFGTQTLTGPVAVLLDGSRTIGSLNFGDGGDAFGWSLAATGESTLALDNGASTPEITVANQSVSISAPLTGSQGLVKNGPGILTLSGNNSYGATTVQNGILIAGSSNALPPGQPVAISSGSALNVNSTGAQHNWYKFVSSTSIEAGAQLTLAGSATEIHNLTLAGGTLAGATPDDYFGTWGFNTPTTVEPIVVTGGVTSTISASRLDSAWGNPLTFEVDAGSTLEVTGIIGGNPGHGPFGVTKTGTGTAILSAANAYGGTTTVSGGMLTLGASDVLANTTDVSLGDATLAAAAAISDTVGTLAAIAAATIDLGAGATLAFADSSVIDWTGGTLNIAGLFVSGSSLRFGFTNAGLTPAQLGQISGPGIASFALDADGYLIDAATGGYSSWATTNGVPGQAANLDHDNDGVSNGVEYFLGGSTGNTTGFTALPGVTNTGGSRSVTWTMAASYTGTYGTAFVVETSETLTGTWTTESVSPAPGATVTLTGNNVKYTFPVGARQFARLKVTIP